MDDLVTSKRHEVFLENVLSGKTLKEAGMKAGFSTPERDAYPILAEMTTRNWFKKRVRGRAETEGLAVCYEYLISVVRDTTADRRIRVDAAKFVYSHHMPAPKALEASPDSEKNPSEMSNEELRQFIEQSEAELANRATPIGSTPAKTLDMLD